MKKKLYLHVGMQKTASTFLHYQVFSKIKNIEIINYKKNPHLISKMRKIIISDETLSGQLFSATKKKKSLMFKNNNTKIILVLRNQKDYLLSSYNFMVSKGVEFRTLDFWLKKISNKALLEKLKYTNYVKFYWSHFGKKNTLILFYEDMVKNKYFFYNQLSKFLGENIGKIDEKRSNYSIKTKYHLLLLIFNFLNISFFLFCKKIKLINNQKFSNLITKISKIYFFLFKSKENNLKIKEFPFKEKIIKDNILLKKLIKKIPKDYIFH